jgi:hypothetical protein
MKSRIYLDPNDSFYKDAANEWLVKLMDLAGDEQARALVSNTEGTWREVRDAIKTMVETWEKPLSIGNFDLDAIVTKDLEKSFNDFMGPLEPPDDYRIYNRKQADGTYPPLSKFFDDAVAKADAGKQEADLEPLSQDIPEQWRNDVLSGEIYRPGWAFNRRRAEFLNQ